MRKKIKHLGGLKELTRDDRDFKLGAIFDLPKLEVLPKAFEIEPYDIIDQASNDFCSAATRAGQKMIMEQKKVFYPALFALSKQISGDLNEWGQDMRSAFKATLKSVPLLENVPPSLKDAYTRQDWAYLRDISNYPPEYIEGGKKHADASFFVVSSPFYDPYDTARAALWKWREKKQTIAIGLVFSWTLNQVLLEGTVDNGFGHMMYVVGWNEQGLTVVNSCGRSAGNDGKHILSRETINYFAGRFGMMMGVDLPAETAKIYIRNKIRISDNWVIALLKSFMGIFKNEFGARSFQWNKTKKEFEKLYPKRCAVCGIDKNINLHHCKPFHVRRDLENDFSNLIWLCREHHFDRGHYRSWASWNDNIREDAAEWLQRIKNRP